MGPTGDFWPPGLYETERSSCTHVMSTETRNKPFAMRFRKGGHAYINTCVCVCVCVHGLFYGGDAKSPPGKIYQRPRKTEIFKHGAEIGCRRKEQEIMIYNWRLLCGISD